MGVAIGVGVLVGTAVGVELGVLVGDMAGVGVGVLVVGVLVRVAVGVGVLVGDMVGVGDGVLACAGKAGDWVGDDNAWAIPAVVVVSTSSSVVVSPQADSVRSMVSVRMMDTRNILLLAFTIDSFVVMRIRQNLHHDKVIIERAFSILARMGGA